MTISHHHIQTARHDLAIVDSGVEPQLKQNECPDLSLQPHSLIKDFADQLLNNVECIDLHVYTKVSYQIRWLYY